MKKIMGIRGKYLLFCFMGILCIVFIGVTINNQILEKWNPDQSIVGTWTGTGETSEFGDLEEIEVIFIIDELGNVTGTIGDARLEECVIKLNRNSFERLIKVKNDYIIRDGHVNGAIIAEDELTYRDISVPFDISDGTIGGTLFHVEAWKYPDPLLMHLKLTKNQ